jgi:hypothetical protein
MRKVLHKPRNLRQSRSQEEEMLLIGEMGFFDLLLRIRLTGLFLAHQKHKLLPDMAGRHRQPNEHLQRFSRKFIIYSVNLSLLLGAVR